LVWNINLTCSSLPCILQLHVMCKGTTSHGAYIPTQKFSVTSLRSGCDSGHSSWC